MRWRAVVFSLKKERARGCTASSVAVQFPPSFTSFGLQMSQGPVAQDTAKKDKDKKGKDKKKKEGWHLYSLFKKTKGFDRNVSAIPPIVREPIEWLISHNGASFSILFIILYSFLTSISPQPLRWPPNTVIFAFWPNPPNISNPFSPL